MHNTRNVMTTERYGGREKVTYIAFTVKTIKSHLISCQTHSETVIARSFDRLSREKKAHSFGELMSLTVERKKKQQQKQRSSKRNVYFIRWCSSFFL